ncbi:hypothetical protein D770_20655 [Flammeovirgaceae bacterium 311]|nr:hypothetical protein D770_20655 [Flammeovirgaceae bacterium 311]
MSSFARFSTILFALMLSCVSIGLDRHEALLISVFQENAADGDALFIPTDDDAAAHVIPSSSISDKGLGDVYGIQQQSEHVVSTLISLPLPASKIHPENSFGALSSVEIMIRGIAQQYLLRSKKICPGLSVSVLIFPFHYFL